MRQFAGILFATGRFSRVLREGRGWVCESLALIRVVAVSTWKGSSAVARNPARAPSCDDCFFRRNLLCALPEPAPCPTFRPYHPDGLRPPQQLRFVFRADRRTRAAWAFPTAQEQAALHA
jgi:hypothetical protein